jgi:hypothetical protein
LGKTLTLGLNSCCKNLTQDSKIEFNNVIERSKTTHLQHVDDEGEDVADEEDDDDAEEHGGHADLALLQPRQLGALGVRATNLGIEQCCYLGCKLVTLNGQKSIASQSEESKIFLPLKQLTNRPQGLPKFGLFKNANFIAENCDHDIDPKVWTLFFVDICGHSEPIRG